MNKNSKLILILIAISLVFSIQIASMDIRPLLNNFIRDNSSYAIKVSQNIAVGKGVQCIPLRTEMEWMSMAEVRWNMLAGKEWKLIV